MNESLVKSLRDKTEEANLDTILKTSFGGYSRKSVLEYISMMRRQQYDIQKSYSEQTQLYQAEREKLMQELAETRDRAEAAEEELKEVRPILKKTAELEKDMAEAVERIRADGERLEQLRLELEQQKEQAQSLRSKGEELCARLEKEQEENKALKQQLEQRAVHSGAQEKAHKARAGENEDHPEFHSGTEILDLYERPETMQIQLALLTRERENTAKRMESVIRQDENLFRALNECRAELEDRRNQNQWMEAENDELTRRLSEQMRQNIALNREIIHIRSINENMKRKLEAALQQSVKQNTPNGSGDVSLWDFAE